MYGCNTRNKDYKGVQDTFLVQDGYEDFCICSEFEQDGITPKDEFVMSRRPRFVYMRNRNSRDCKYDRVNIDPKCAGCTTENHLRDNSDNSDKKNVVVRGVCK